MRRSARSSALVRARRGARRDRAAARHLRRRRAARGRALPRHLPPHRHRAIQGAIYAQLIKDGGGRSSDDWTRLGADGDACATLPGACPDRAAASRGRRAAPALQRTAQPLGDLARQRATTTGERRRCPGAPRADRRSTSRCSTTAAAFARGAAARPASASAANCGRLATSCATSSLSAPLRLRQLRARATAMSVDSRRPPRLAPTSTKLRRGEPLPLPGAKARAGPSRRLAIPAAPHLAGAMPRTTASVQGSRAASGPRGRNGPGGPSRVSRPWTSRSSLLFLIFTGAALLAAVALYTRQPLLVAYIAIGALLDPWFRAGHRLRLLARSPRSASSSCCSWSASTCSRAKLAKMSQGHADGARQHPVLPARSGLMHGFGFTRPRR